MYILHVSVWFHLPGPLWLLPDVVSIIYPASIGQYWSRLSALLPYWQQDNGASNNNGSEKEDAAVLQNIGSLFAQLDIHEKTGFIKVWCCHLATLGTTCTQPLCENTPCCLFTCCLTVDNGIQLNGTTSSKSPEQNSTCNVSNVINFLPAMEDTQYGMYMRLLICQNQTIANVSPVQITFTIGCHL